MRLRLKISLVLLSFLLLISVFSAGVMIIFEKLYITTGTLYSLSSEHKMMMELEDRIGDVLDMTNNWAHTGEERYRAEFRKKLAATLDVFRRFDSIASMRDKVRSIEADFNEFTAACEAVISVNAPVGNNGVLRMLQTVNLRSRDLKEKVENVYESSIGKVIALASRGEAVRQSMIYYLSGLIIFGALLAGLVILSLRRMIAAPITTLITATERFGRGDISFRLGMKRKDEFGVMADRFDSMAAEVENSHRTISRKLADTELLLAISDISAKNLEMKDLKDALILTAQEISAKLESDSCIICFLDLKKKAFCPEAIAGCDSSGPEDCLSAEEGIGRKLFDSLQPAIIDEEGAESAGVSFLKGFKSSSVVPIIRDGICTGLLAVSSGSARKFTDDDVNTLRLLANSIGTMVKNAELYRSVQMQLKHLSVLQELSVSVTSLLDMDELLRKIAAEISRLLSSRGCIIRLIENNRLIVKSSWGFPRSMEDELELPLGSGIAGWVAEKGISLLVKDVAAMPPDMKVPVIDTRTVICVPLKVGDAVIGTLAVYDKLAGDGSIVSFTDEDLHSVEGFASISAIAIDKSRIFEHEVRREKEAVEAKKRLDILFDSVQGGIITLDRDYTIIAANRYVEEWTGMPVEELIGRSSLDIFHDRIGICPHCAAKATFESGDKNSIMQSRGINYAELSAFPVRNGQGEIVESVVFIQDITERVLYQEETLSLYREVIQTKEYIEGIIENSADAIVTSDLEGIITSWNQGATKIYGYTEAEAMGKFLPFVPEFLLEGEKENFTKIRHGEVLKDIEIIRKKKDGTLIEASLTLSPIKDATGNVIGISGISRDISEKKAVEKELIRRNQELSRLFFISSAMRSTLELDKLLRMVLIAVTMGDGMGFNRAILLLVDEEKNALRGAMGVGPASTEEAWKIWGELTHKKISLADIIYEVESTPSSKDSFIDRLARGIEIPLEQDTILARTVKEKRSFNVVDVRKDALSDAILIQQIGTEAYAAVPLISRDRVIGVIWVDNYFNRKQITDEDMQFLASFSNHMAAGIENARLFEQVSMAEHQLENIFESMSDMVYFNSKDYEIKRINKAVCKRLGLPPEEILGKKCFELFHGQNEPYHKCPHHKTVNTKLAYIEEIEEPVLGGTFLTSSSPIFDLTGEFIGSVHVVRDISELKVLREKLVTSEKMAALGEVAAKVAHEIRNPLVSVGGFAKRLEKKLDGNLREYAAIIVKEVARLESILKEILGFVKEMRLSKEITTVNDLIEDVLSVMRSDLEDRGITVFTDFASPVSVYIDPHRVKEALMNIISNAMQSLTGAGSIYISTYVKKDYSVMEISDTGKGITADDLPNIFNPFFTTKPSGTGLGLAITHRIIQEHNGSIEVTSTVDKGSTFKVFIPIKEG